MKINKSNEFIFFQIIVKTHVQIVHDNVQNSSIIIFFWKKKKTYL